MELRELLGVGGSKPSLQQLFAAGELLQELEQRGAMPDDPQDLAAWLAPILCTNRVEQERFRETFRDWLARQGHAPKPRTRTADSEPVRVAEPPPRRPTSHAYFFAVAGLIFAALVAITSWQYLRVRELSGVVVGPNDAPIDAAVVRFLDATLKSDAQGRFTLRARAKDLPAPVTASKLGFAERPTTVGTQGDGVWRFVYLLSGAPIAEQVRIALVPDEARKEETVRIVDPPARAAEPVQLLDEFNLGTVPSTPRYLERAVWPAIALILVPWILLGAIAALRRQRAAVLQRVTSHTPQTLRQVNLTGGLARLTELPVRRLAQELRRRRLVQSDELQVAPTLEQTLRRYGLFTPVYGSRVEQDYLVFIDTASISDHQARLAEELVGELQRADVQIERFAFDRNASICRPRGQHQALYTRRGSAAVPIAVESRPVSLDELAARWPERTVLVFGNAPSFFDGFSGAPASWVSTMLQWHSPVLLTARAEDQWDESERVLERLGFVVLPFSREGLLRLMSYSSGAPVPRMAAPAASASADGPMPPLANLSLHRWVQRAPPPEPLIESLCARLKADLGERGCAWLAACAAYPEIHWGITLRLGVALIPSRAEMDRLLPRLSSLIWFRQAFMPDWLRLALLERMEKADEEKTRHLLAEMLDQAGTSPHGDLSLHIATSRPVAETPLRRAFQRYQEAWRRWRQDARATAARLAARPGSPLRDHVFLLFVEGNRTGGGAGDAPSSKLGVSVGRPFVDALFRERSALMGLKPWVRIVGALVLSIAAALILSPIRRDATPMVAGSVVWSRDGKTLGVSSVQTLGSDWQGRRGVAAVTAYDIASKSARNVGLAGGLDVTPNTRAVALVSPDLSWAVASEGARWRIYTLPDGKSEGAVVAESPGCAPENQCATFSPDGSIFAYVDANNRVLFVDRAGAAAGGATGAVTAVSALAVSRAGNVSAASSVSEDDITLASRSGGMLLGPVRPASRHIAVSADGSRLVAISGNGSLSRWRLSPNLAGIESEPDIAADRYAVSEITLDPTGRLLAAAQYQSGVALFDLARGSQVRFGQNDGRSYTHVAFSGSTGELATVTAEGYVSRWAVGSNLDQAVTPRWYALIVANDFASDGGKLGYVHEDATGIEKALSERFGFGVTVLQNASQAMILDALGQLSERLMPQDNLLIYFTGGGTIESGSGWPVRFLTGPGNALSSADLERALRQIRAHKLLMSNLEGTVAGTLPGVGQDDTASFAGTASITISATDGIHSRYGARFIRNLFSGGADFTVARVATFGTSFDALRIWSTMRTGERAFSFPMPLTPPAPDDSLADQSAGESRAKNAKSRVRPADASPPPIVPSPTPPTPTPAQVAEQRSGPESVSYLTLGGAAQRVSNTDYTLAFGDVPVGRAADRTLTVTNSTATDVRVSIRPEYAQNFQWKDACSGRVLKPTEECQILMQFIPRGVEPVTATLAIEGVPTASQQRLNPVSLTLTGTGTAAAKS